MFELSQVCFGCGPSRHGHPCLQDETPYMQEVIFALNLAAMETVIDVLWEAYSQRLQADDRFAAEDVWSIIATLERQAFG